MHVLNNISSIKFHHPPSPLFSQINFVITIIITTNDLHILALKAFHVIDVCCIFFYHIMNHYDSRCAYLLLFQALNHIYFHLWKSGQITNSNKWFINQLKVKYSSTFFFIVFQNKQQTKKKTRMIFLWFLNMTKWKNKISFLFKVNTYTREKKSFRALLLFFCFLFIAKQFLQIKQLTEGIFILSFMFYFIFPANIVCVEIYLMSLKTEKKKNGKLRAKKFLARTNTFVFWMLICKREDDHVFLSSCLIFTWCLNISFFFYLNVHRGSN